MVAFALRADGWWLRQDLIWHKPNPMPESVTDRCTKSHEYIFLLAKSSQYYYDNEAIKETATGYDGRKDTFLKGSQKYANGFVPSQPAQTMAVRGHERWQKRKNDGTDYGGNGTGFQDHSGYSNLDNPYVRNKRSVWTVNTKPYSGAHFATFPEELIIPMIKAGTSEKGVCPDCGKPWERIVESKPAESIDCPKTQLAHEARGGIGILTGTVGKSGSGRIEGYSITLGWQPTCKCGKEPVPAIVLDCFSGAGTSCMVAKKLWRRYIGIELNAEYVKLSQDRIDMDCGTLF
jgi:DNA modification methylase